MTENRQAITPLSYPIWMWGFFIVLFLSLVCSLNVFPKYITASGTLRDAATAYDSGEYDKAITCYRQLLIDFPTSKEVRIDVAIAFFSKNTQADNDSALWYLSGLVLDDADFAKLKKVMPAGYEEQFEDVKP